MDELSSKNRARNLLYPRITISYYLRDRLNLSNAMIGKMLNRKHSTITYYINEVYPNEHKYNKEFRDKIMKVEEILAQRKDFIKGHKLKFIL
ncbi:MAG: helix-turn-helix domain-containing protein [Alphaproteobacteria bacterium]